MQAATHHHHQQAPCAASPNMENRHTYTHLTYSRHHLVDIAMETIKIAENGEYTNSKGHAVCLKGDLDWAVEHCSHYGDEFDFNEALRKFDDDREKGNFDRILNKPPSHRFQRTDFLVVSASWLEAASELLNASTKIPFPRTDSTDYSPAGTSNINNYIRVGVLNSASGTTPGGRFLKGTVSQEDCLCRASLLYSCISQPKFQSEGRFYGKNRSLKYGSSNCVIFSPDVPVIREDTVEGKLLDKYQKVSFVTIPAPNAFTTSSNTGKEYNDNEGEHSRKTSMSISTSVVDLSILSSADDIDFNVKFEEKRLALLASLSDRIHRALAAFVLGNCTDLVLPAFGCGVHGNDPSMVASVFRNMLTDPQQFGGRFRTVVFAIPPSRKHNYQAFAAYFQKKEAMKKPQLTRGVSVQ
eukprot:CCRYP_000024-RB/>CCRYP_000024-RB protein AED:0.06 eAED:0.06 QI:210/1/1/1/1/1/4/137/410